MAPQPQSLGDVLNAATVYLAERDVYQPRLACEYLACRLLSCKRLELLVRLDSKLSPAHIAAMRRGVKRLANGEPPQYVTGQTEFIGRGIKTDARALIPRPETEALVERLLASESLWANESPVIADIGTGSGCIAIAICLARPNARCIAADISPDALSLAAENAASHGVLDRISFVGADLAEHFEPDSLDAVVANLPYVATADWEALPKHIRDHEPRAALDGGEDGLDVLREVVPDTWMLLKDSGLLYLEFGEKQTEPITALLMESGFVGVTIEKDLAGMDRIAIARRGAE
jgi:release factor glutamine methyltransferase